MLCATAARSLWSCVLVTAAVGSGAPHPRLHVLRLAGADLSLQRLQPVGHVLRQVFAVSSAALAWYFTASFAFQFPVACLVQPADGDALGERLADSVELYQKVLLAATALWFLVRSILLIDNAEYSGNTRGNLIIVTKACLSSKRQAFLYKSNSNSWQFSI